MKQTRANSSIFAILIILLVIAGVIYLFWQSTQVTEEMVETETMMEVPAIGEEVEETVVEETVVETNETEENSDPLD